MSLENIRDGAESAPADAPEVATQPKPKVTRKRTPKTSDTGSQVAVETLKPKVTRVRKAVAKPEDAPEASTLESSGESVQEAPKNVVRRRTSKRTNISPTEQSPLSDPATSQSSDQTEQTPQVDSAQSVELDAASSDSFQGAPHRLEVSSHPSEEGSAERRNIPEGRSEEETAPSTSGVGNSSEGEYYNDNGGYRAGRMSYRERRMLRRQERQTPQAGQGQSPSQGARGPERAPQNNGRRFEGEASGPVDSGFPLPVADAASASVGVTQLSGLPPASAPFSEASPSSGFRPGPASYPQGGGFSQPGGFPQNERSYEPRGERDGRFDGRRESRWERRERERRERLEGRGENSERPFVPRRREYDFAQLSSFNRDELGAAATEYGLDLEGAPEDDAAFVLAILEAQAAAQNATLKTGILDIINDSKAYLRCDGYLPGEADVYVSNTQIKRSNLKAGDLIMGPARAPKENERYFGLLKVETVNGLPVEAMKLRKDFEKLTPVFPDERFVCETEQRNITARIIDLISPIGKGQRGLIVAPPKAGKTTLIKNIANSIMHNYPEAKLFVLLIDERPEEVTDISRSVRGEVVASTFDETPDNHMRVAEIVMERAKRLAEMKQDVVILLDSITRLSRASNLVVSPSGRTLSGGLDPAAMYKPKRMFGAARNLEEGGSLTILATALVDTGSRMDEMIFEEFKGTGNMDLVLDRNLFDQRIFPAIDINRSGTRRDDLLMSGDELTATYHLRRTLAQLDNDKAVNLLIDRLKNTKSNAHFMEVVAKSARQQGNGG